MGYEQNKDPGERQTQEVFAFSKRTGDRREVLAKEEASRPASEASGRCFGERSRDGEVHGV